MYPTPVFLTGEFHGQRSLVGSSPWGRKKLDMAKSHTHTHTHTHTQIRTRKRISYMYYHYVYLVGSLQKLHYDLTPPAP